MVTVIDKGNRTGHAKAPHLGIKPHKVPPRPGPLMGPVTVNGVAIPEAAIRQEAQNHPASNPGEALFEAARALVVRELLLQEARECGIECAPETRPDGRIEAVEDAMIRVLVDRNVNTPAAGREECERYYAANPTAFCSPSIFHVRHILIAAAPDDNTGRAKARTLAEKLLARLRLRPSDFGELAKLHSDCPSGTNGGDLGQIMPGDTVPEFERVLDSMNEGELSSRPVESRYGVHIIHLDRKIVGEQLEFDAVRERIAAWLEAASWSKAVAQYVSLLAANADIDGIKLN